MSTICQHCGASLDLDVPPGGGVFHCCSCLRLNTFLPRDDDGRIVFDRWEVLDEAGQGANAVVCRVRAIDDGTIRALKLFISVEGENTHAIKEFVRARDVTTQIEHPNVVRLYDAGEWRGIPYILEEFVDGIDLAEYLENYGEMDQYEAFSLGCYVCDALDYVWSTMLMIHRDMKPHNIMLTHDGDVKICDFGMITSHELAAVDLGAVEGTPYYLSPECITEGAYQDNRSDIYALGATLFHVIGGVPPFDYGNVMDVLHARVNEEPPDLATVRSGIDPRVAAVVRTMMARRRDDRYATAAECLADMQRVLEDADPVLVDPARPRVNL